jgi:hypothetical protein
MDTRLTAKPTLRELVGIALIVFFGFIAIYAELAFATGGW